MKEKKPTIDCRATTTTIEKQQQQLSRNNNNKMKNDRSSSDETCYRFPFSASGRDALDVFGKS